MKLTKLMLSASIAALALVSCNKQDTTPEPTGNRLKTVEVSLENVIFTKGLAGQKVNNDQPITVKSFQLFLTDNAGNEYEAKTLNGQAEAKTYWGTTDLSSGLPVDAEFHYVSPNCTKVVAVANMPKEYASYAALKAEIENLAIGTQQDQDNLALYGEATLSATSEVHNDTNTATGITYTSPVYKADITLYPRIARFEVDGFAVEFNATPKYNTINITQLAIQNYYPEAKLISSPANEVETTGTLVNPISNFNLQQDVYDWLDTPETPQPWYRDYFDLTLTPSASVKDLPNNGKLAYHVFATDAAAEVPVFVIKLTADGQAAFLYTKRFLDSSNQEIKEFLPGHIYRMSGEGEVTGNKGTIVIPEDKIDPMDRCLDIKVDVSKWQVSLVTPEF